MWWSGGSADCIRSGDSGRSRHPSRLASRAPRDARKVWRAHLADSDFKQPCAIARALWSAPGRPSCEFQISAPSRGAERRQTRGLARPPVDGRRDHPWDALRRRPLAPFGTRRLPALHCGVLATGGPRFRERGPATPVSQLLAAGHSACERSPAIARAPEATFASGPRRRIDRWRDFPGHRPGGVRPYLRPLPAAAPSSRRPMTTPLNEQDGRTLYTSTRNGQ